MHGYRVVFADLLTGQTLHSEPNVSGLKYGRRIGEPGEISGSIAVTEQNAALLRSVEKQRTAVWVYFGLDLMVGGVLWDVVPRWSKRSGETWAFTAATFESYLNQVVISEDIGALLQVDQLEIARSLVQHMQADDTANIGIQLDPLLSGVLRDRTQYLASGNKSYGEALKQLGEVEGGFEWTIDVWRGNDGHHVKYLRFGYPRLGSQSAVHVLERDALEDWSTSSTGGGTRYRARGGTPQGNGTTEQQPCLSAVHSATELLAAGWPRIDVVTDYSSVTNPATLESHAARDLANALKAQAIPQVSINLAGTRLRPQAVGETVRLRHRTVLRGATDEQFRLIGIEVTPSQRGQLGTATLTLEAL
jgi:hypothetical protein